MTRVLLVAVALLASACARQLVPAPGAQIADGRGKAATASVAGVNVVVNPDAWRGLPTTLGSLVTPLLVTIDNQSGSPVRVRWEQFALHGPGETRFAARPPLDIDGYVSEPVAAMPYAAMPYGAFGYDPFWRSGLGPYGRHYPWPPSRRLPLPTRDMVERALPEGIVEPGARTTGFAFFDRATQAKGAPLEFTMDLVDANTNERFAQVRIPFVVK